MFFNRMSTNRKITQLETDIVELKRSYQSLLQEWDATSLRVTKTLRRLRSSEVRRELAEGDGEGDAAGTAPLTTVPTPPDRMTRIRQQLAGRKEGN